MSCRSGRSMRQAVFGIQQRPFQFSKPLHILHYRTDEALKCTKNVLHNYLPAFAMHRSSYMIPLFRSSGTGYVLKETFHLPLYECRVRRMNVFLECVAKHLYPLFQTRLFQVRRSLALLKTEDGIWDELLMIDTRQSCHTKTTCRNLPRKKIFTIAARLKIDVTDLKKARQEINHSLCHIQVVIIRMIWLVISSPNHQVPLSIVNVLK